MDAAAAADSRRDGRLPANTSEVSNTQIRLPLLTQMNFILNS